MKPIFIFGQPKSGTSLLLSLLEGHRQVLVFPVESRFFRQIFPKLDQVKCVEELRELILNKSGFATFNPAVNKYKYESNLKKKNYIDEFNYEDFKKQLLLEFGKIDISDKKDIFLATANAFNKAQFNQDYEYFLEKTPGNEFYLDDIDLIFPKARIVHIVRNPKDNFSSHKIFCQQKYGFVDYNFIDDWRKSTELAFKNRKKHNYLIIKYEDLVCNTEDKIKQLCLFLEIDFSRNLLQPTILGKSWPGNSTDKKSFSKVMNTQINKYEKNLENNEIQIIDNLCLLKKMSFLVFLSSLKELSLKNRIRLLYYYFKKYRYKNINFTNYSVE